VLRTLIIDDEAHVRESLTDMLKHYCPNAKVIGQAEGVKTGIKAFKFSALDYLLKPVESVDLKEAIGLDKV